MSKLFRELNKGKPPKPSDITSKENKKGSLIRVIRDSDSDDEEERKDQFNNEMNPIYNIPSKPASKYSPLDYHDYFDSEEFLEDGTKLYEAGNEGVIFFCLHGAGHTAISFAALAGHIKNFAQLISFDFPLHGQSKNTSENSIENLIEVTLRTLDYVIKKHSESTIIIVGHSMGGAVATKACAKALEGSYADRILGLIVIDVVEGSALDALPFMEAYVSSKPKRFKSIEDGIQWTISSGTIKNLESARISVPTQLMKVEESGVEFYTWITDLIKAKDYWRDWFVGLTSSFLLSKTTKVLLIAEKDRMDKELTIAQMQGKFRLILLYNVGHLMHEDDPLNTARSFYEVIEKFKIPGNTTELKKYKEVGPAYFHPNLREFN